MSESYTCPVCGFNQLTEPAYSPTTGLGSYDICPSCGFEYGVSDDDDGISQEQWRSDWIAKGMSWSSQFPQPENWNPKQQVKSLNIDKEGE